MIITFEPLNEENIEKTHQMCEDNVSYVSHSLATFRNATIFSDYYKPDFAIVASDSESNIIAFFMIVFRKPYIFKKFRNLATLKFFVVDKNSRNQGIGSQIFNELLRRIKNSKYKCYRMKLDVSVSMPDYWYPGLDLRHTEAFFFLKKHGFKKNKDRNNLCVDLKLVSDEQPTKELNGIYINRATSEQIAELSNLLFMPLGYRKTSWPAEIRISYKNNPVSTFVAQNSENKIIGWATHSVGFPGTFGPTGVNKKYRGRGLGGILLKWCLWDLKKLGLDKCIIRWVEEDTAYFYLKSVRAHFCESYWTMKKRF
jgi:GNAT superfamily N-acetyltransferase